MKRAPLIAAVTAFMVIFMLAGTAHGAPRYVRLRRTTDETTRNRTANHSSGNVNRGRNEGNVNRGRDEGNVNNPRSPGRERPRQHNRKR